MRILDLRFQRRIKLKQCKTTAFSILTVNVITCKFDSSCQFIPVF